MPLMHRTSGEHEVKDYNPALKVTWVYNMTLAECCVSVNELSYCKQSLYTAASVT